MTATLLSLTFHIRIVGILMLLIALMHLALPKRFAWSQELARLSLFNRQVFIIHCIFIVMTVTFIGILSLTFAPLLLDRSPLATVILSGLVFFWTARMFAQHFYYSPKLWRGNRFHTALHLLFSCLWIYIIATYGTALYLSLR